MTSVSVIICTCNPRMDLLHRVLDAMEKQTLGKSRYEVIIVDNNSEPALQAPELRKEREMTLRLLRETRQGLSFARCCGIRAAQGQLFVFVDDDNFLEPDYLEAAWRVFQNEPKIGAFGGISKPALERPVGKLKNKLLPYLGVRDYGEEVITSDSDHWGQWEPIGAGMCCRRDVAEAFVRFVDEMPDAGKLGRQGTALLSGEDSLFARLANRLGYACSYQPSLKLSHYIKKSRLTFKYFARLIKGHGQSYVVLQRVLGKPVKPFGPLTAAARLGYRLKTAGTVGAVMWFWDLGYMAEAKQPASKTSPAVLPAANPSRVGGAS